MKAAQHLLTLVLNYLQWRFLSLYHISPWPPAPLAISPRSGLHIFTTTPTLVLLLFFFFFFRFIDFISIGKTQTRMWKQTNKWKHLNSPPSFSECFSFSFESSGCGGGEMGSLLSYFFFNRFFNWSTVYLQCCLHFCFKPSPFPHTPNLNTNCLLGTSTWTSRR